MGRLARYFGFEPPPAAEASAIARAEPAISLNDYLTMLQFGGLGYPVVQSYGSTPSGNQEPATADFIANVQRAYKSDGVVFAVELARLSLFSEARFQWRQMRGGKPGELFGTAELALLETPWTNAVTGDLLTRAEQDASLAGNFYAAARWNRKLGRYQLKRMRPDWVTIALGSEQDSGVEAGDLDADVLGYIYEPGGPNSGRPSIFLDPGLVMHYAPNPDPEATFRGMSWLTPVLREIAADQGATIHKSAFFEHAATPNMAVKFEAGITPEKFSKWVDLFEEHHVGAANAYQTLYLGGGAEPMVVGADFRQMDFKTVQGAGETRIAAAGGVPPVIVGLSEGLASATYSNYGQAKRRFADLYARPAWRMFCASAQHLMAVPGGAELWYDERGIAFLRDDATDAAAIQAQQATMIAALITAGFLPDSVIKCVEADDFTLLKHSGLYSVQLQPAGSLTPATSATAPMPPAAVPAIAAAASRRDLDDVLAIVRGLDARVTHQGNLTP